MDLTIPDDWDRLGGFAGEGVLQTPVGSRRRFLGRRVDGDYLLKAEDVMEGLGLATDLAVDGDGVLAVLGWTFVDALLFKTWLSVCCSFLSHVSSLQGEGEAELESASFRESSRTKPSLKKPLFPQDAYERRSRTSHAWPSSSAKRRAPYRRSLGPSLSS